MKKLIAAAAMVVAVGAAPAGATPTYEGQPLERYAQPPTYEGRPLEQYPQPEAEQAPPEPSIMHIVNAEYPHGVKIGAPLVVTVDDTSKCRLHHTHAHRHGGARHTHHHCRYSHHR